MLKNPKKLSEGELLTICLNGQGGYLPAWHAKNSCSTTYGPEFIEAAAYIYLSHLNQKNRYPQYAMSASFQEHGIRTCRGGKMTSTKMEYLIETHLKNFLRDRDLI